MDTTKLGEVAASLMERLAEEAERESDTLELGEIMVLAEVQGARQDAESGWTGIAFQCSDDRGWIQRGLLHAALAQSHLHEDDDE